MAKKSFKDQINKTTQTHKPDPEALQEQSVRSRAEMEGTDRLQGARTILIERIKPDPNQPRKEFDQDALEELAASIKKHGVMQPISVEYNEQEDFFQIVSGERRYRASLLADLTEMPCIIHAVSDEDRLARQLIENIQREDLSPIEKARGLIELKQQLGEAVPWTQVEEMTGLSRRRRQQFTALLELPEEIQSKIVSLGRTPAQNQITEKHARALLTLKKHPEKQLSLFDSILTASESITGDRAIEIARGLISTEVEERHRLVFTYTSTDDLIQQLRSKLTDLTASDAERT